MRKKDFRYLHASLKLLAQHIEENVDDATVTYEHYEEADLDTHMNFQSLKEEELEAVEALRDDIMEALDGAAEQKPQAIEPRK